MSNEVIIARVKAELVSLLNDELLQVFAPVRAEVAAEYGLQAIPSQVTEADLQNVWSALRHADREDMLGIDSLDSIEFVMALEEAFELDVSDSEIAMLIHDDEFANVDAFAEWLAAHAGF